MRRVVVPVSVREGHAGDLEQIAALHALSQLATYGPFLHDRARDAVPDEAHAFWTDWFAQQPQRRRALLVAEDSARLVAFGLCEGNASAAMLRALHVRPGRHGEGTGSLLLMRLVATAEQWGARRLHLNVIVHNLNARRFYEAHHWSDTGHRFTHAVGGQLVMVARYVHLSGADQRVTAQHSAASHLHSRDDH